ncbi:hypothetical protein FIBSPDRAFT_121010 [Athelia psychrophila]|uniref:Extracellular membrane protein CFEM domain-containing protein n=1 Tax=Athelia psychrophila TaxID=1759441 RepID=A0A166CSJ3_9AGAM|nr:hypothetical protein FIBSPDRAFT_121010 [Fibularhizoctonia sp. CBS 109695]
MQLFKSTLFAALAFVAFAVAAPSTADCVQEWQNCTFTYECCAGYQCLEADSFEGVRTLVHISWSLY